MVASTRIQMGSFISNGTEPGCVPIDEISYLDSRDLYTHERSDNSLAELAKAVEEYAKVKRILVSRYLGNYVIDILYNLRAKVITGTQQEIYGGCTGDLSVETKKAARAASCPKEPSLQCASCYKKFIAKLQEDNEPYVPDETPESNDYERALKALGESDEAQQLNGRVISEGDHHEITVRAQRIKDKLAENSAKVDTYMAEITPAHTSDTITLLQNLEDLEEIGRKAKLETPTDINELRRSYEYFFTSIELLARNTPQLPKELVINARIAGNKLVLRLLEDK